MLERNATIGRYAGYAGYLAFPFPEIHFIFQHLNFVRTLCSLSVRTHGLWRLNTKHTVTPITVFFWPDFACSEGRNLYKFASRGKSLYNPSHLLSIRTQAVVHTYFHGNKKRAVLENLPPSTEQCTYMYSDDG